MCPLHRSGLVHLPWVMLGLRAAARKDTVILPSQAVFGSTVCLSVQLSLESELDLYGFLQKMKATLSGSEIVNSRFNTAANQIPATVLPQPLLEASHVLVRRDGHVPPLVLLYSTTVPIPSCGAACAPSPS